MDTKKKMTKMERFRASLAARVTAIQKADDAMTAFLAKSERELLAANVKVIHELAIKSKGMGKALTLVARTKMPSKRGRPAGVPNKVTATTGKKPAKAEAKIPAKRGRPAGIPNKMAASTVNKSAKTVATKPAKTVVKKVIVSKPTPKVNLAGSTMPKVAPASRKPTSHKKLVQKPVAEQVAVATTGNGTDNDPTNAAHS